MEKFLVRPASESGQAIVEYVLMLAMVVGVVTFLGIGFKSTIFTIWEAFAREISAACPGCPAGPEIRIK